MTNKYTNNLIKTSLNAGGFLALAANSLSVDAHSNTENEWFGTETVNRQFLDETMISENTSIPSADTLAEFQLKVGVNEYEKVRGELHQYYLLGNNWDGYGAQTPSSFVIGCSEKLLELFRSQNISAPNVMLSPEGEVSFYWEDDDKYIELIIELDGRYSAFVESKNVNFDVVDLTMPELFNEIDENLKIEIETF